MKTRLILSAFTAMMLTGAAQSEEFGNDAPIKIISPSIILMGEPAKVDVVAEVAARPVAMAVNEPSSEMTLDEIIGKAPAPMNEPRMAEKPADAVVPESPAPATAVADNGEPAVARDEETASVGTQGEMPKPAMADMNLRSTN